MKKSERILVYEESGCSRSAAFVVAYIMKKNKLSLKVQNDWSVCSQNVSCNYFLSVPRKLQSM